MSPLAKSENRVWPITKKPVVVYLSDPSVVHSEAKIMAILDRRMGKKGCRQLHHEDFQYRIDIQAKLLSMGPN